MIIMLLSVSQTQCRTIIVGVVKNSGHGSLKFLKFMVLNSVTSQNSFLQACQRERYYREGHKRRYLIFTANH